MSSRPRVLVTGADGQVGRALLSQFANTSELIACNRQALDLSNPDQIRSKVRDARPDIILNAGAYTAVDRAETERDLALSINGRAPACWRRKPVKLALSWFITPPTTFSTTVPTH